VDTGDGDPRNLDHARATADRGVCAQPREWLEAAVHDLGGLREESEKLAESLLDILACAGCATHHIDIAWPVVAKRASGVAARLPLTGALKNARQGRTMSMLRGAFLLAIVVIVPPGICLSPNRVCLADEAGREEMIWTTLLAASETRESSTRKRSGSGEKKSAPSSDHGARSAPSKTPHLESRR